MTLIQYIVIIAEIYVFLAKLRNAVSYMSNFSLFAKDNWM